MDSIRLTHTFATLLLKELRAATKLAAEFGRVYSSTKRFGIFLKEGIPKWQKGPLDIRLDSQKKVHVSGPPFAKLSAGQCLVSARTSMSLSRARRAVASRCTCRERLKTKLRQCSAAQRPQPIPNGHFGRLDELVALRVIPSMLADGIIALLWCFLRIEMAS